MNKQTIESIQSSGFRACIVVAGGGSGAVHALLAHAGASRFVLDVQIPYSREAMNEFLGERPDSYCSEQTVKKMAEVAFNRAVRLSDHALGIACTAALSTHSEREDDDRAFICIRSGENVQLHEVAFSEKTRAGQECELSQLLIERLHLFIG